MASSTSVFCSSADSNTRSCFSPTVQNYLWEMTVTAQRRQDRAALHNNKLSTPWGKGEIVLWALKFILARCSVSSVGSSISLALRAHKQKLVGFYGYCHWCVSATLKKWNFPLNSFWGLAQNRECDDSEMLTNLSWQGKIQRVFLSAPQ